MSATPAFRLAVLAAFLLLGGSILAARLSLTYDLAFFLPAPQTEAQRVLVERLGQGPGSRLLFLVLPTTDAERVDQLAERLRALDEVDRLLPPAVALDPAAIPAPLWEHRYLLGDVDLSAAGLRHALSARLRDLAFADDPAALRLIAADPHLASLAPLSRLGSDPGATVWRSDEASFLVLETRAPAFDIAAQADTIAAVQALVTQALGAPATLYGAGAYGVDLQRSVQTEATALSLAATAALVLVLGFTYRRPAAVVLVSLPVLAGAVAGLASLALLFEQVHGITLAFGFTLLGVTLDYGVHALSHARHAPRGDARDSIWPTLALGALSSGTAYLAFVVGGSRGLVQLGVLSAVGIAVAALFAWYLLPTLLAHGYHGPARAAAPAANAAAPARPLRFRYWPALAALAVGSGALAWQAPLWNNDLSALTPVAAETLAEDHRLRTRLGAPDIRYLVATRTDALESTLDAVHALDGLLAGAQRDGLLGGYRIVTTLLPSRSVQDARRERLDPAAVAERLTRAVAATPFRADAFAPFLADVSRTATSATFVEARDYAGTELESLLRSMLYRQDGQWVALTFLVGLDAADALTARLAHSSAASELVDLGHASRSLLAGYRERVLTVLTAAALLIVAVLGVALRAPWRVAWIVVTLAGALALGSALTALVLGSLSLFDLIATTLVAGLGLDYALFFSRGAELDAAHRDTRHAIAVCVVSTGLVFTLLALSSIPVLRGIGTTVGVGVTLTYLLARFGRYAKPAT